MKTKEQDLLDKQLLQAVWQSNVAKINELLVDGANPLAAVDGNIPLFSALNNNNLDVITALIQSNKIDANARDQNGNSLLVSFMQGGFIWNTTPRHIEVLKLLINLGVDVNATSNIAGNNESSLKLAITARNPEVVQILLEAGANINQVVMDKTPLAHAIELQNEASIDVLLKAGADINPKDDNLLITPLGAAINTRNHQLVELLLERGAEINPINCKITPLTAAIHQGDQNLIERLQTLGAEINPKNLILLNTPLTAAISRRDLALAENLIQKGAEINPQNSQTIPLKAAAQQQDINAINLILNNTKEIDQKQLMHTILELANWDPQNIKAILLPKITDINVPMNDGMTLLEHTVQTITPETQSFIRLLVNTYHAEVTSNHIQMAIQQNNPQMKDFLINHLIVNYPEDSLSTAIKYKADLADELLSKGTVVNQDTVMHDLADAIQYNNHAVIHTLLKHGVNIDWNQPIDKNADNLMMLLARHHSNSSAVAEFITLKTPEGLPIFRVNQQNNNGAKLIDIFKQRLDAEGEMHLPIIQLLREHGSIEPSSAIIPDVAKLDIVNVHNSLNEKPVRQMQAALHAKYDIRPSDIQLYSSEITQCVESKAPSFTALLEDEEFTSKALRNLDQLENDQVQHIEHNNTWSSPEELAYLYLEAKSLGRLDSFVITLAEVHSCKWGQLVNLCKVVENDELKRIEPVIDFDKIAREEELQNDLTNKAMDILLSSGISEETALHVVHKFHSDVTTYYDKVENFSAETELVVGSFFKAFEDLVTKNGKTTAEIYSVDAKRLYDIVKFVTSEYDESINIHEQPTRLHQMIKKASIIEEAKAHAVPDVTSSTKTSHTQHIRAEKSKDTPEKTRDF